MWYFLRALWHEDGLTQRELSVRVGTMEPTTLSAILVMEKKGLVRRVRNPDDRRKWHIHLTPKGRAAKAKLLPLAREVVDTAVQNLSRGEVAQLLKNLADVQKSLNATLARLDGAGMRQPDRLRPQRFPSFRGAPSGAECKSTTWLCVRKP